MRGYLVGDKGPELVKIPAGSTVIVPVLPPSPDSPDSPIEDEPVDAPVIPFGDEDGEDAA